MADAAARGESGDTDAADRPGGDGEAVRLPGGVEFAGLDDGGLV